MTQIVYGLVYRAPFETLRACSQERRPKQTLNFIYDGGGDRGVAHMVGEGTEGLLIWWGKGQRGCSYGGRGDKGVVHMVRQGAELVQYFCFPYTSIPVPTLFLLMLLITIIHCYCVFSVAVLRDICAREVRRPFLGLKFAIWGFFGVEEFGRIFYG